MGIPYPRSLNLLAEIEAKGISLIHLSETPSVLYMYSSITIDGLKVRNWLLEQLNASPNFPLKRHRGILNTSVFDGSLNNTIDKYVNCD